MKASLATQALSLTMTEREKPPVIKCSDCFFAQTLPQREKPLIGLNIVRVSWRLDQIAGERRMEGTQTKGTWGRE